MNELAKPEPAKAVAAFDEFKAQAQPNAPNPLMMIPADWRSSVAVLWTTNAHLLPSALALCARLKLYSGDGLTGEQVRAICKKLTAPEKAANHRFAADLLADLSGEVAAVLRSARIKEQTEAMREEGERFTAKRGLANADDLFPAIDFASLDG